MPRDDSSTRAAVTAYITVEITDQDALRRAALEDIERTDFGSDDGRATAQAEVHADPLAAVSWLIDPNALADGIPGVRVLDDCSLEVGSPDVDDEFTDGDYLDSSGHGRLAAAGLLRALELNTVGLHRRLKEAHR